MKLIQLFILLLLYKIVFTQEGKLSSLTNGRIYSFSKITILLEDLEKKDTGIYLFSSTNNLSYLETYNTKSFEVLGLLNSQNDSLLFYKKNFEDFEASQLVSIKKIDRKLKEEFNSILIHNELQKIVNMIVDSTYLRNTFQKSIINDKVVYSSFRKNNFEEISFYKNSSIKYRQKSWYAKDTFNDFTYELNEVSELSEKNYNDTLKSIHNKSISLLQNVNILNSNYRFKTIGDTINILSLTDYEGSKFSIDSIKNKYILFDFFFLACPPCIKSLEQIELLKKKYGDKIYLISINPKDFDIMKLKNYITKYSIKNRVVYGKNAKRILNLFFKDSKIEAYPTFILLDTNKKIVFSEVGYNGTLFKKVSEYIK